MLEAKFTTLKCLVKGPKTYNKKKRGKIWLLYQFQDATDYYAFGSVFRNRMKSTHPQLIQLPPQLEITHGYTTKPFKYYFQIF